MADDPKAQPDRFAELMNGRWASRRTGPAVLRTGPAVLRTGQFTGFGNPVASRPGAADAGPAEPGLAAHLLATRRQFIDQSSDFLQQYLRNRADEPD